MRTVSLHEARMHLSRLVERAAKGEGFIIAKAGKPLVKVAPLDTGDASTPRRLAFLEGESIVPDDFDRMGQDEIERQFGVGSWPARPASTRNRHGPEAIS